MTSKTIPRSSVPTPQQAVVEVTVGRDPLRLAGRLHGRQHVCSAKTVLAGRLGESDRSHALLLHCTSLHATSGVDRADDPTQSR